jgi:hypothetical protein
LVAAIELVSPANKDRPAARRAFAIKCASYLLQGVGLVIVDVVTDRHAHFHDEIIELLELDASFRSPIKSPLYAASYRTVHRENTEQIDVWVEALRTGTALPTVPLHIQGFRTIPLDLEAAYTDARKRLRLT